MSRSDLALLWYAIEYFSVRSMTLCALQGSVGAPEMLLGEGFGVGESGGSSVLISIWRASSYVQTSAFRIDGAARAVGFSGARVDAAEGRALVSREQSF